MTRQSAHAGSQNETGELGPGSHTASLGHDTHHLRSSLQHLLNSNEPPLESEAVILRNAVIPDAEKRALELDAKLSRISNTWKEVAEERMEVQKRIDANRAILSPVRALPNDIIFEIFTNVAWYPNYDPLDLSETPWILTRICSRWRCIALSMPSLWSSLTVIHYEGKTLPKNPSSILQTALARSGNQTLTIFYICTGMPI